MKEIEVKILGINVKKIAEKLDDLGAEKVFDGLLRVRYFDTIDSDIRKRKELLRVRQFVGAHNEICYKKNKQTIDGMKITDEYDIKVDDFDVASEMLKGLGFEITCYYEKKRAIYNLNGAEIVIDRYPKIPPFIEIEAMNNERIEEVIEEMGLGDFERSTLAINELLEEKYPNIRLNNLRF